MILSKIRRFFDLNFVASRGAEDARLMAALIGVPMAVMYDGGLELKAEHLIPLFNTGKPVGDDLGVFVVGEVRANGELRTSQERYVYNHERDSWEGKRRSRPRKDQDIWITEEAFLTAYYSLVYRVLPSSSTLKTTT